MSKNFKLYVYFVFMFSFLVCGFGLGYSADVKKENTSSGNANSSVCASGIASAKIVYNTNGGNELDSDSISSRIEDDTSLPVPVREGYLFDGWYYDTKLTNKVTVSSYRDITYTPKKNANGCTSTVTVNLYAKWQKAGEGVTVTTKTCPTGVAVARIVYNTNGGNTIDNDFISSKIEADSSLPTPKRSGYIFKGWYYDSNLVKKVTVSSYRDLSYIAKDDEYGCTQTVTVNLYAKWEKDGANCSTSYVPFRIIYNTNGGSKLSSYDYCSDCSLEDEEKLPVPARDGYVFNGWYYDSKLTKKVTVNYPSEIDFEAKVDSNGCGTTTKVNLYAKWTKINSVSDGEPKNCPIPGDTFEVKYHTYTDVRYNNYTHCSSCVSEKVQIPIPEREGYKFDGWYYNEAFTDKVETDDASKVEYIQEYDDNACNKLTTVNLYARWLKINSNGNHSKKYQVVYNTMGGNKVDATEVNYNSDDKNQIISPTKKGYRFVGWYYDEEYINKVNVRYLESLDDKVEIFGEDEVITLYAKWEKESIFSNKTIMFVILAGILVVLIAIVIILNKKKSTMLKY